MTNTAKEFFDGCRRLNARIQGALDEQERIGVLGSRVTASYSDMPRSAGSTSTVERAAMRLVELERQIDIEIDELIDLRDKAKRIINQLTDDRYRDILSWRYFSQWSWERIAERLHYDRMQVWRLHEKALAEAENLL